MNVPADLESLGPDDLVQSVHRPLLDRQLRRIEAHNPFYADKFREAGVPPRGARADDFTSLPFTEKTELLAEQQAYPPFGRLMTDVDANSLRRVHVTSGATGRSLFVVLTEADVAATHVAGRRAFACAGLTAADTVIHCLSYCLWAGGVTDHLSLEATGATVIPFGVGHTKRLIETILGLRPTAISCTPSYMSRLEVAVQQDFGMNPRDLGLRKAFFGGEGGLQRKAVRERIERTWGIDAIDANYGMADVLSIFGAECPCRAGLHFHGQGILHLELIDPETGRALPVREGTTGEAVLTNLTREAQPLVRYRTHDLFTVAGTDQCACGRRSLRFRVEGRSDDMFVVRGVNVYPDAVGNVLAERPGMLGGEFEVVLDTPPPFERPLLLVELASGSAQAADGLECLVVDLCRDRLSFTPRVQLVPWGSLSRTDGKKRRVRRTYSEAR